jgi:hypothetical protein
MFLHTLTFASTPGGRPTLEAVQFLQRIEGRPRASMGAAPRAVIPRSWQRYVLPRTTPRENGQQEARVDRPAYTVCVVERLHEALRRHDIFVDPSERGKCPEMWPVFALKHEQLPRMLSSSTIGYERNRLSCGPFWIVSVHSRAKFPAFARSMQADGAQADLDRSLLSAQKLGRRRGASAHNSSRFCS